MTTHFNSLDALLIDTDDHDAVVPTEPTPAPDSTWRYVLGRFPLGEDTLRSPRIDLARLAALAQQQAQAYRHAGHLHALATCLGNQALILTAQGDPSRSALPLAEEALRLAKEHGLAEVAARIEPLVAALRARPT